MSTYNMRFEFSVGYNDNAQCELLAANLLEKINSESEFEDFEFKWHIRKSYSNGNIIVFSADTNLSEKSKAVQLAHKLKKPMEKACKSAAEYSISFQWNYDSPMVTL